MGTKGYSRYRGPVKKKKGALAVVLVLLALAAAAFLVVQNYIVYDADGSIRLELPFSFVEKEPVSTEIPDEDVHIDYLPPPPPLYYSPQLEELHCLMLPELTLRNGYADTLAEYEPAAVALTVKRLNGGIAYMSQAEVPSEVAREGGMAYDRLQELLAGDTYAVARMISLCDSYFVRAYPEAAIQFESGMFWFDDKGNAWLDPAHPQTLAYLTSLCEELVALGFDEIVLDYFSYPLSGDFDTIYGLEDTDKPAVLLDFARSLRQALPEDMVLGVVVRSAVSPEYGLTWELLSECFDRVYLTEDMDRAALLALLPESFESRTRLVSIVDEPTDQGSYLLDPFGTYPLSDDTAEDGETAEDAEDADNAEGAEPSTEATEATGEETTPTA